MPRVNGSRPGSPSAVAGSKPLRCSGPYTTSIGMPEAVCRRWSSPISAPSPDGPSLPRGPAPVTIRAGPLTPQRSGPRAVAGQERPQQFLGGRPLVGAGLEQDRVPMCTHVEGDVVAAGGTAVGQEGELP